MGQAKTACVMVVDDHADTVRMIDRLLTARGYSVVTATSAAQAAGLLRSIKCDLIVSDIGLPDGSGLALMREVAARYGMKGIAVSGHAASDYRQAAEQAGFQRFLSKPVDFNLLLAHVGELTA